MSKHRQTGSLSKLLGKQGECEMTCAKCYKQFTMGQDQVMSLMLSGLQVECGECDKPTTTTTTDEQTNDNSEESEPPVAEAKVTHENRQVF